MRIAVLIAAALLSAAAPAVSEAQGHGQRDRGGDRGGDSRRGQTISMGEAVAIAKSRSGGRVIDASLSGSNYRIRLMVEGGRVVDYLIDAATGAILSAN